MLERILPRPLYKTLRAFERFTIEIVFQKIIGTFGLALVYFLIIGPISIGMRVFFKSHLRPKTITPDSTWVLASPTEGDMQKSFYQS